MALSLFSFWESSGAYRARLVLSYKKIPYKLLHLSLSDGAQHSEEYSQKNPMKQIPCLLTPEHTITQSVAIIYYLEQMYPNPSIIPKDPYLATKAFEFTEIINSGVQPYQNRVVLGKVESLGGNKKEWVREFMMKGFNAAERIVKDVSGTFCVGDSFTIADAFLLPQLFTAQIVHKFDLSAYPNLLRIGDHIRSLPDLADAHPENQIGYIPLN